VHANFTKRVAVIRTSVSADRAAGQRTKTAMKATVAQGPLGQSKPLQCESQPVDGDGANPGRGKLYAFRLAGLGILQRRRTLGPPGTATVRKSEAQPGRKTDGAVPRKTQNSILKAKSQKF
jgi:hypothetical protein